MESRSKAKCISPTQLMNHVVEVQHPPRPRQRLAFAVDERHVAQDVHGVEQRDDFRLDLGPLPRDVNRTALVHRRPHLLARSEARPCIVQPNAASNLTQLMGCHFELVYSLDDRLAGHQLPGCHLHSDLLSFCMLGSLRSLGRCCSYQP